MRKNLLHGMLIVLCALLPVSLLVISGSFKKQIWEDSLSLPYTLPDTELLVSEAVLYSREGDKAGACLGLILENRGERYLSYVSLQLSAGESLFTFETTWLPPGGRAVVFEKERAAFTKLPEFSCITGSTTETFSPFLPNSRVRITTEDGGFSVENLTDREIPSLWVYYAAYNSQWDALSGPAHICTVPNLAPGEKRMVTLPNYDGAHIKILGGRQ